MVERILKVDHVVLALGTGNDRPSMPDIPGQISIELIDPEQTCLQLK
jgi:hypothetical protein